jgi:hypothetical protein
LPALLELRCIALHPAHDGRMRDRQAALRHHLHQVPQTEPLRLSACKNGQDILA